MKLFAGCGLERGSAFISKADRIQNVWRKALPPNFPTVGSSFPMEFSSISQGGHGESWDMKSPGGRGIPQMKSSSIRSPCSVKAEWDASAQARRSKSSLSERPA